jgi:hypothetical protein
MKTKKDLSCKKIGNTVLEVQKPVVSREFAARSVSDIGKGSVSVYPVGIYSFGAWLITFLFSSALFVRQQSGD